MVHPLKDPCPVFGFNINVFVISIKYFWKLRKEISPRNKDPSNVMLDSKGDILASNKSIEYRALEAYTKRLEVKPIKPHLKRAELLTNKLCEARLETPRKVKSQPWVNKDLMTDVRILQTIKQEMLMTKQTNSSKEINVAGDDFILAVLK